MRDLQLFNREADQLDASTSAQAKLLENLDVGDNFPDVELSLKRHEDFSATLTAQEERVGAELEMVNRLVDAGHYSSNTIQDRKEKVVLAGEKLKVNSAKKRGELDESKLFQEFRPEVSEMNNFVAEKRKLVREESFKAKAKNVTISMNKYMVEFGIIDESKAIAADENDVAKVSKAFEKFLTANKKLLEHIDAEAVILPKDVSGQARKTHKLYDGLVKLQKQPENLEASFILFQKSCKYLLLC